MAEEFSKLDYLRAAILRELAELYGSETIWTVESIRAHFREKTYDGKFISADDIGLMLGFLEGQGLVVGYHHDFALPRFKATKLAYDTAREEYGEQGTILNHVRTFGDDWLYEVIRNQPEDTSSRLVVNSDPDDLDDAESIFDVVGGPDSTFDQDGIPVIVDELGLLSAGSSSSENGDNSEISAIVPASDRYVELDHNSDPYKAAVAALDEARDAFKVDHSLDNELGPQKAALNKALEAGRTLLDDVRFKFQLAEAFLIIPLREIVVEYKQTIVGIAAAKALDLILEIVKAI